MQFIANGPDIPDALLQAHEEGRVVFFCGAGISCPAGLPGFGGLVDRVYTLLNTVPTHAEKAACDRSQYDAALNLLENRFPGRRSAVRRAVVDILQPNMRRKGAAATHQALLCLARGASGATRLVTTNFDRVFVHAIKRNKHKTPSYVAPLLPIPKDSRWDGLVYLHGLITKNPEPSELNQLVLTSGDFGLAYLTERWAARFAGELFRNYVVCFVGYSINDPILRYMMDALAADRMLGQASPLAYALGECAPGEDNGKLTEWKAKGVEPILYRIPASRSDHSLLHQTLERWAEMHRDGVLGRERIVVDSAQIPPSLSTQQDDFVGRMVWALCDPSGLPAKRFAELKPAPALEWLWALNQKRYFRSHLARFGVASGTTSNDAVNFSVLNRPAPTKMRPG